MYESARERLTMVVLYLLLHLVKLQLLGMSKLIMGSSSMALDRVSGELVMVVVVMEEGCTAADFGGSMTSTKGLVVEGSVGMLTVVHEVEVVEVLTVAALMVVPVAGLMAVGVTEAILLGILDITDVIMTVMRDRNTCMGLITTMVQGELTTVAVETEVDTWEILQGII